jgi:tetratricopeptide (TPR) repeat protein
MEMAHPKVRDGTMADKKASGPAGLQGPKKLPPALKALNDERRKAFEKMSPAEREAQLKKQELERDVQKKRLESVLLAGDAALREKNFREALNLYANAEFLDKGGQLLGLWPQVGKMKALGGVGETDTALNIFKKIENTPLEKPGMGEAVLAAADVYIQRRQWDEAEKLLKKVAHLPPAKDRVKKTLAEIEKARAAKGTPAPEK